MIAKLGFFASHLNIDDSVSVLCELHKTPVDSELQNPVNKIMILLTLERKYLKVEQSFAQSRFHITSLLSLAVEDGMLGRSGCHVTPIMPPLQPAAGLHIFTSSYPHITHTLHCNETHNTRAQDKTTSINYLTGVSTFKEPYK